MTQQQFYENVTDLLLICLEVKCRTMPLQDGLKAIEQIGREV